MPTLALIDALTILLHPFTLSQVTPRTRKRRIESSDVILMIWVLFFSVIPEALRIHDAANPPAKEKLVSVQTDAQARCQAATFMIHLDILL